MHLARFLIVFLILLLVPAFGAGATVECAQRFAPGADGVPATGPGVRAGLLAVPGFRPVYLEKHSDEQADPLLCEYTTAYDIFRLSYQEPKSLPAGCYGDFNGDGRRDYALLLQDKSGEVIPHVFLAVPPGYRVFKLPKVTDPYGYNEDHALWPGPFCMKKPADGQFRFLEGGSVHVVGDVIQVGWYGYYGLPDKMQFEAVLIQD